MSGKTLTPLSLNRYAYCVNSGLNFVDPNGMLFEKLIRTAENIIKNVADTTKHAIRTSTTYAKAVLQQEALYAAQLFGEYSINYFTLPSEKQNIIQDAICRIQAE